MSKYFICLANSSKPIDIKDENRAHNETGETGRCVAGIEITHPGGEVVKLPPFNEPNWIRPIANTPTGAIPVADARSINLLDIIKIDTLESIGHGAHSEDYSYSSIERVGRYNGPMDALIDKVHKNYIFGSKDIFMDDSLFQRFDHSLMLIRPKNVHFFYKVIEKDGHNVLQLRVSFHYGHYDYDLPITDPIFKDKCYQLNDDKCTAFNDGREYFFAMSLGLAMPKKNNFHYKLVAAVLYAGV